MKKSIKNCLPLALLIGVAPISEIQAAPAAPTLTSKSEGFAAWLPAKPTVGSQVTQMPGVGKMTVKFYTARKPPLAFIVMPMRLPGKLPASQVKRYFDGVQRGFTASAAAAPISTKNISLGAAPGREVVVKVGPNIMHARFYALGNRSYQLIAISPPAKAKDPQITKFFDAFRILP